MSGAKAPRYTREQVEDLAREGEAVRDANVARGKRRDAGAQWVKDTIIGIASGAAWLHDQSPGDPAHLAVMERINRDVGAVLIEIDRRWDGGDMDESDEAEPETATAAREGN